MSWTNATLFIAGETPQEGRYVLCKDAEVSYISPFYFTWRKRHTNHLLFHMQGIPYVCLADNRYCSCRNFFDRARRAKRGSTILVSTYCPNDYTTVKSALRLDYSLDVPMSMCCCICCFLFTISCTLFRATVQASCGPSVGSATRVYMIPLIVSFFIVTDTIVKPTNTLIERIIL